MTIQTIRPGLLVSLKTSVTGNVRYDKRIIDTNKINKDGSAVAKWETTRTVIDAEEQDRAIKCRSQVRSAITGVCTQSNFGLLCPETAAEELEQAVAEARRLAEEFNRGAVQTRVKVFIISGKIAQNDVEAVKAINSEVSDLLKEMEQGIAGADVEAIRAAANKAKGVAEMLSIEARTQAEIAIKTARAVARELVKAEGKSVPVDRRAMRTVAEARLMFIDTDDAVEPEVVAPKVSGRQLDMAAE